MAADKMFLVIEGVTGESNDENWPNAIEVLGWSWGASQNGTLHEGGGSGAGQANFQDLSITKWVDASSPILLGHLSNGSNLTSAQLILVKDGERRNIQYFTLEMTNLIVSSLSAGGTTSDSRSTEDITLHFAEFVMRYIPINADGTLGTAVEFGYNIQQNVEK